MMPRLSHPWSPRKMVWGGLPLVAVLIWLVPDALFTAKELDSVLSNQLPMAHQLAVGSLFLIELCQFRGLYAQVADRLIETATSAIALAIELVAHHAAVLRVAGCDRELAAKSLPYLQCQGRCLMHLWMTYTR